MPFIEEQIQFIYLFQSLRGPFFDGMLRFLNFFDTQYFLSTLVALIWAGFSWRWGARLGYILIITGWINAMAKLFFAWPRPSQCVPDFGVVTLHDFGFPSAGAQNAMLLGGLIIYYWKSRWAIPLGLIYILVISFSRVLLGVHFPLDLVGGWVIGLLALFVFIKNIRWIENIAKRHSFGMLIASLVIAVILGMRFPDQKTLFLVSALFSISLGIYLSCRFSLYHEPPKSFWKKIRLGFLAIGGAVFLTGIIQWIAMSYPTVLLLKSSLAGLWISLFVHPLAKKIGWMNERAAH